MINFLSAPLLESYISLQIVQGRQCNTSHIKHIMLKESVEVFLGGNSGQATSVTSSLYKTHFTSVTTWSLEGG